METALCLTLSEVAHRSSLRASPLDIFRILNLCRPCDWRVLVSFDTLGPRLLFLLSDAADPEVILGSTPIGLFHYDTITIGRDGKAFTADWRQQFSETPNSNLLRLSEVDSSGYPSRFLEVARREPGVVPSEFGEFSRLRDFLLANTWLGSKGIPNERFCFSITTMGHRWELRNRWQHGERAARTPDRVLEIEYPLGSPPIGTMYVTRFEDDSTHHYRLTEGGLVSEAEMAALGWPLSKSSFPAAEVEVRFPERQLGPDGTMARDSKLAELMAHAKDRCLSLKRDLRFQAFEEQCRQRTRYESARRIDKRKDELTRARFVYFGDRLVYRLPTNENELVSLHQKLEGMGGLPFAHFSSLEYTPKLGIDAIANFKIEATAPSNRLATVEFEYRLENYFSHDHPHEQTDLIVCWDGSGSVPQGTIHRDPARAWLWFLRTGNRIIPVARVKDYPRIDIRKLEGS